MDEVLRNLSGPYGGVVALAFGMGAASGYGFAMRSITAKIEAMYKERIEKLESEVNGLKQSNKDLLNKLVE